MESEERLRYAKRALDGVALGDCFGQSFFMADEIARQRIKKREISNNPLVSRSPKAIIIITKQAYEIVKIQIKTLPIQRKFL